MEDSPYEKVSMPKTNKDVDYEAQTEIVEVPQNAFTLKVRKWIRAIGAEELGVERIPESYRTDQHTRDLATIFFAANCNTANVALGYLGPTLFGLGWWDSFLSILFFNLLGAVFPAWIAMFGPKLGLRTMILPRYSFGWYPAKVLALLNCINQIGWGIVNGLSGAAVLEDASDSKLPLAVAVLVVGLVAICFGLLGYRQLHAYTRYSWIVMLTCFIVVAGFGAKHFVNVPMGSGATEASGVLSFGASIIGFELAWLLIGADYGVYIRETVPARVSFSWAFLGLITSQLSLEWLGAAIGTLSKSTDPQFAGVYEARGIGGLMGACFAGYGEPVRNFGRFIEAVLSFSTAAVVTTNIYSLALSVQMISKKLLVIPRFIWCALGSMAFLALAIAGRAHLEDVLENFLLVCAYWITPFTAVFFCEHFIWRRHFDYDVAAYNDKTRLPYGIAASISWIVGTVISFLSMSQEWAVAPIAKAIGPSNVGTDISWILALAICPAIYIPLRYLERKRWKF